MQKYTFLRDQFPGNRHSRNSKPLFERKIVCRSDPVTLTHRLRLIRFHDHLSSGPRIPISPFLRLHPPWLWSSACCIIKPIFALLARIRLCLHPTYSTPHARPGRRHHDLPHNCRYHHLTRYLFINFRIPHHDTAAHPFHLLLSTPFKRYDVHDTTHSSFYTFLLTPIS